ncbi:MAG: RHS repeat-associated core domain-containing protein, partial [bacterium]|nr:RHS repeat-associated core domain-containing protein [bacterium]
EGSRVASDESTSHPTSYDPFGNPQNGASSGVAGYRGELQHQDRIHLRNRDYDPTTGTFLTPDPLPGVDGTTTVANAYHYVNNDPLNLVDPLGLRPEDCNLSSPGGCRYVVNDLMDGGNGGAESTPIGLAFECWQASDYAAEATAAGNEAGIDPRMVYAIFDRESKCPRGPLVDQGAHECYLWGRCDYPSLGPTNFEGNALNATLANHPELLDGIPNVDYGSVSTGPANAAWLLIDTGDRQAHATFAARSTAFRLADLNSALDGLIAKHRIKTISLSSFQQKKDSEPGAFFLFRSSLLGLGWFGGGEMRNGRTQQQGIYRMEQALTGAGFAKANVAGDPSQCYVNVYGQSFTGASAALNLSSRATC